MVSRSRGDVTRCVGVRGRRDREERRGETGPARTARETGTDERSSGEAEGDGDGTKGGGERWRTNEATGRGREEGNGGAAEKGGKKRQVRVEGEIYRQRSESTATRERIQGEKKREREMWSQEAVEVEEE